MCVLYIQFAFVYSSSHVFWECVICFLRALESVFSEEVLSYSVLQGLGNIIENVTGFHQRFYCNQNTDLAFLVPYKA